MKRKLPVGLPAMTNYFLRRVTPGRILLDYFMQEHIPELTGDVLEVGSAGSGRSELAINADRYILSNLHPGPKMIRQDMLDLDLEDTSIDALVSEVMLEHVPHPLQAIREAARVLKPGGKFVLVVPWMYPFHAAPDDYYRFSKTALRSIVSEDFEIMTLDRIGSVWSTISLFIQLKVWPWGVKHTDRSRLKRALLGTPLLLVGLAFYLLANLKDGEDDFAMLYGVVAVKK
jgi:SAM-dependent methyltransferase